MDRPNNLLHAFQRQHAAASEVLRTIEMLVDRLVILGYAGPAQRISKAVSRAAHDLVLAGVAHEAPRIPAPNTPIDARAPLPAPTPFEVEKW
jgi:hypothetical protein